MKERRSNMNLRKLIALPIVAVLVLSSFIVPTFAASGTDVLVKQIDKKTVEKTFLFHAKDENALSYDAPEKIVYEGKEYKFDSIRYNVDSEKNRKITRKVKTKDKNDFKKTITKTIDGKKVVFTADPEKIDWKKIEPQTETASYTKEYASRNDVAQNISIDGKDYSLTGTKTVNKTSTVYAPATFAAPSKDCNKYAFNGKVVTITGNTPTWGGYQNDLKDYLGINGSDYKIQSGTWKGEAKKDGEQYLRTASYRCTRTTPTYVATYVTNAASQGNSITYEADVTYTEQGVYAYAVATYVKGFPIKLFLAGAGLLVTAAAIATIFYILAKRKKEEEEPLR